MPIPILRLLSIFQAILSIVGIGMSAYYFQNSHWLSKSISHLGTGYKSGDVFSAWVVGMSVFGMVYIGGAIFRLSLGVSRSFLDSRLLKLAFTILLVGFIALIGTGIVSTIENRVFHYATATTFFLAYPAGILLVSQLFIRKFNEFTVFSRLLVLVYAGGMAVYGVVFEGLVPAELFGLTLITGWNIVFVFYGIPRLTGEH